VVHLESTLTALDIRDAQSEEMAVDAEPVAHPVVTGGDFNTFFYFNDIEEGTLTEAAVKSFIDRGHDDVHRDLPLEERYTSFDPFPMVIDLIFSRGLEVVDAGRCPPERCDALSDHLPVFAELRGVLGE
jgi:endonuclease/exonuclease/phosphatase (EEP) superfamily protein YafD